MNQQIPCPACAKPTGDGLLCSSPVTKHSKGGCTEQLRANLELLPSLMADVTTTITRQSKSGDGGRKGSETPLPFDWDASDARWVVHNTLTTWVRELDMGDTAGLANNPRALCRWLADRIERIKGHNAAAEMVDEIAYNVSLLRNSVDRSGDSLTCGDCEVCGAKLYAGPDAKEVTCRFCWIGGVEVTYPVQGRREGLMEQATERLISRHQILEVAPYYGAAINPSTFRTWIHRGELVPEDHRNGTPLYRLAHALRLARRVSLVKEKRGVPA